MARTEIPIAGITIEGINQAGNAQVPGAAEMQFGPNDGLVFIEVHNASTTTAEKFTLVIPGTVDGIPIADEEITVAKEATELYGPFPTGDFDNKGAEVFINAASAELKFRAFRL